MWRQHGSGRASADTTAAASAEGSSTGGAGHDDVGVLMAAGGVDVEEAKRLIEREGFKVLDVR